MNRLTERLRRNRGDDAGLTLVELLVVMVVMTVIVGIVAAIFTATTRTTEATRTKIDQGNQGRVATEAMTKALRTAVVPVQLSDGACASCTNAFISGGPFSVSFYADIDNPGNAVGPSQVVLAVDPGGHLTETIQPPDPSSVATGNFSWTGSNASTCTPGAAGCLKRRMGLADGVQQDPTKPLFSYYPYGSSTPLIGTLNADQLKNVDAIDVVLSIKLPSRNVVVPTQYVDRVALSNVDVYVTNQQGGTG